MEERQNKKKSRIVGNNLKFKRLSGNGQKKETANKLSQLYIIQPQLNKKQFSDNKGRVGE